MIYGEIVRLVILSLAVSNVSMVMTKSGIFKPYRDFFDSRFQAAEAGSRAESFWHWWAELTSCPWCTSHWVTLLAVVIWQPRPVESPWWIADLVLAGFASITLSAFWSGLIFQAFTGMHKHKDEGESE